MKKTAMLMALSVSAVALTSGMARAEFTLDILHINDLHSRIEPINRFDSTCSAEDDAAGECFGGIARVKTKIDERRDAITAEGGNVLVLDAGDQFQGSLFYTTYKGEAAVEFMNGIGFDAMAVGNHEFDDGPEALAEFIEAADFPVISGNTLAGASSPLADMLPGYVITEVGGEKIGIVSVLATDTDETSSPGPTILLIEETNYLTGAVAEMEAEGVNKIILLSHVGLPRDREIAAAVEGIDVIVGGHSHTLLSNVQEDAADVYPVVVQNPSGQDVPIVQAYAYSKYLGELQVTFDDEGNVISAEGEPHLLDASVEPDEGFVARVQELAEPIEELKVQPVGETTAAIEGSREVCRAMECEMGNLVADAMLDRVRDQGIQIAIQNGGGLRASIDSGEITMGEVLTVLPFQNTLATFQLKGEDVIGALENGVGQIEEGAGRFPQVAGLSYTFDASAEPGNRISDVMVVDAEGNETPLDPDATYGVVSNNYMRGGGDGYAMFAENAENAYDYGPGLEQVVADYLAENSPYEPYTDGRIMAAADAAAMEEEEAPAEETASGEMAETEEMASDETAEETEVVPPETALSAESLSTEGPMIETEEAPAEEMASEEMAETEEMASDETAEETEVVPPETALSAESLSTEGPMIETEEAPAEEMASEEMAETEEMASEETEVVPPETALSAESLSSEGPVIEAGEAPAEEMASDEMAETDEMASEEAPAEDMASEEEMASEEMAETEEMASEEATEDMASEEMASDEAMAEGETYVIEAGDTLWEIAREFYGDATMWSKIADANPDLMADNLEVGMEITVPAQ
ncbi:5'-nucleotidase C-terminal domain-containing protein [Roseitalea porphyridii]|jgi:5'-nucleotidase/UDP-sugar diphosphatase|uniref:5'-nucleotidase C-terminal domain-containing protein n=1 Tax=Roseitalea porphyridii TaxID=1852022 RepID=UPI0032EDB775